VIDLKVEVGGLELKNPVILASASYTSSAAGLRRHIPCGYGAVTTKTVTVKPLEGAPNPTVFWYDKEEKTLLSGAEALKNPGIDKMAEAIEQVNDLAQEENCKIIGSCAGNTLEEILSICEKFRNAGVSAIELNMVCPATGPHLGEDYACLGKWWSSEIDRSIDLINSVKKAMDIPVWAKLPLAKLIEQAYLETLDREARPDAYSFVGGRLPNLKIDVKSGKPVLPGNLLLKIEKKLPISPMVTGPVKPSTILHTAYLRKLTTTPLACSGGLTKGDDIIEAIMARR
jgi:dihydroorotate dehydrogenase